MPQGDSGEEPRRPLKKERRGLFVSSIVQREEEEAEAEVGVGVEEVRNVVVAVSIAIVAQRRLLMPITPSFFSSCLL